MNHPQLSIVLPTYNRADLLPRAINSVLNQEFQDWELIVWDDGSTDSTSKEVQKYNDARIFYHYEKNHGNSYSLNQAIEKAKGDFIAFLDDDDEWLRDKTSAQLHYLLEHPEIDMIFGNYRNVNLVTGEQGIGFSQNASVMRRLTKQTLGDKTYKITGNFLDCLARYNFIHFDSVIIRREMVKKIGKFNESLRNGQDFEYWWRFGLINGKAAYSEELLLNRNKYPSSLSNRSYSTFENHFAALDSCAAHAVSTGQSHLVKLLDPSYRNSWQNLITWHGSHGNTRGALTAFSNSLKYGFRPGSVRLLLQAMVQSPFTRQGKE